MEFLSDEAASLNIAISKISALLNEVYVGDNFVEPEVAANLFETEAIKKRGTIICAVEKHSLALAGCVIVVPSDSPACYLAQKNESEMHLLCVKKKYRRKGLGALLINSAINRATVENNSKMLLWTQQSMSAAQRLYSNTGFTHIDNFTKNNRQFLVFEKTLV
jgi:ribosomal protein S18 acetylase RimI-like enzyme